MAYSLTPAGRVAAISATARAIRGEWSIAGDRIGRMTDEDLETFGQMVRALAYQVDQEQDTREDKNDAC